MDPIKIIIPPSSIPTVITVTQQADPTPVPPNPEPIPIKMSIGTNVPANDYVCGTGMWCDVTKGMSGWYSVGGSTVTYDQYGYPASVVGGSGQAGALTYLYSHLSGTYLLSWKGAKESLFIQGKSLSNASSDGAGGWVASVQFNAGDRCEFRTTGGISNVSLMAPDAKPGKTFREVYVNQLKQFKVIRLMCLERVNGIGFPPTVRTNWGSRVTPSNPDQTSREVAAEHHAQLCKESNSIPWVCIPYGAPDDFITGTANIFKDFPISLWEYSNEPWNTSPAYQGMQFRNDAVKLGIYGTDPNVAGARYHGDLTVRMGALVSAVIPKAQVVLGAQMAWDAWAKNALTWVPKGKIHQLAIAPYFQTTGQDPVTTVAQVAQSCQNWMTQVMVPGMKANKAVADTYGCGLVAYEGGQSLVPNIANAPPVELQWQADISPQQYAAYMADPMRMIQVDPAMATLYDTMFKACSDVGMNLFCHFMSPGGGWGRSGFWSTKQQASEPDGVKDTSIQRAISS